jgi:hypothetical protein
VRREAGAAHPSSTNHLFIYSFIQLINYTTKTKDEKRLPRGYRDGD